MTMILTCLGWPDNLPKETANGPGPRVYVTQTFLLSQHFIIHTLSEKGEKERK